MDKESVAVDIDYVIREELKAISSKRKRCNPDEDTQAPSNLFGIALSGGGIRSATVNLGVLKILNKCGILALADYLSTVSGGGYIGGYVHARLKSAGQTGKAFRELFDEKEIEHLKRFGFYLAPGTGLKKTFNELRLSGAFVFSLLMNWIWIASLLLSLYLLLQTVSSLEAVKTGFNVLGVVIAVLLALLLYTHFFFHGLRKRRLWSSDLLYSVEGMLLLLSILYGLHHLVTGPEEPSPLHLLLALLAFLFTGFFANPNIITMHRFYRDSLAAAYLKAAGRGEKAIRLRDLNKGRKAENWHCAPYPLINTCLNLTGVKDDSFKGAKSSDYFLLSPLYCGSRLTGYADTEASAYGSMTLPTAVAVSGAAVNPSMGVRTNRVLSFLMTLLDLKLGYWAVNPKRAEDSRLSRIVWWPYYNILELLGKMDTRKAMVNISDGGHIENLGVYELLRRRCRLIIAVDASADPEYSFSDLKNLVIRARNELGVAIDFRQEPEECIKPLPSRGFSLFHFVVADIRNLPGKEGEEYEGLLVYMKSSLRASQTYKRIESESYGYKLHHPAFPHESTADQFFDSAQWQAYYTLGRFMAGDLLKVDVTGEEKTEHLTCGPDSIDALYGFFDRIRDKGDLERHHKYYAK